MPNSGEKYAMERGAGPRFSEASSSSRVWYQRGCVRYSCRPAAASPTRATNCPSAARVCSSSGENEPSIATGSRRAASQRAGLSDANSSSVGLCHDQRRLLASSASGASGSGRTVRTVNRRIALTRITLGHPGPEHTTTL